MMRGGVVDPAVLSFETYARELYSMGEIIAGSKKERVIVEKLRSFLEEIADEVLLEPVEVLSWRDDGSYIEIEGLRCRASLHPYAERFYVEGASLYVDEPSKVVKSDKLDLEDKVLVVRAPEDPDDYAIMSWVAARRGALAVIFVENKEVFRRIVMLRDITPCLGRSDAPPIPSVSVTYSRGKMLVEKIRSAKKLNLVALGSSRRSIGYNVIATLSGSSDSLVYVTAHHDRWLTGFSDNVVGLAIILSVARKLRDIKKRSSIRIVSFTAEEGGEPSYSPFYWAYGSRRHIVRNAHLLDHILLDVNSDVVARGTVVASCIGIETARLVEEISNEVGVKVGTELGQPIYDSFSFALVGIPAVTFNTFGTVLKSGVYHSDGDTPKLLDHETVKDIINVITEIARVVDEALIAKHFAKSISDIVGNLRKRLQLPAELLGELLRVSQWLSSRIDKFDLQFLNFVKAFNRHVYGSGIHSSFTRELEVREESEIMIECRKEMISIPDCSSSTPRLCREKLRGLEYIAELMSMKLAETRSGIHHHI